MNDPTDLRSLLDVQIDSVKKPPTWPQGLYHGFIEKYEPGESREKKTKLIRVFLKVQSADASIPEQFLKDEEENDLDFSKRQLKIEYYLTQDSLFRLTDMLKDVGIDTAGKSLGAALPELVGKPVLIDLRQQASKDGTQLYNNVESIKADVPT